MKKILSAAALLAACGAASAGVIGTVDGPTGRIDLMDDVGPCVDGARQAMYVPTKGKSIGGCWVSGGPMVMIVFFDADIARIPVAAITPPKAA